MSPVFLSKAMSQTILATDTANNLLAYTGNKQSSQLQATRTIHFRSIVFSVNPLDLILIKM
jgi:hypothetical protein